MNVSTGNFDMQKHVEYFDKKKRLSRTYVRDVKAVKLKSMRNTTLRLDTNGDYVFRYHNADIVKHHPDGWVTVDTHGWHTRSTFERVRQASGLQLFLGGESRSITDQRLRIVQVPWSQGKPREGKATNFIRRTLPFLDGMRIQQKTGEIHPEDAAKLPSERRVKYQAPSKEARQEFKALWGNAFGHIVMSITFGDWAEKLLTDPRNTHWVVSAMTLSRAKELNDIDVEDNGELYNTFMQAISGRCLGTTRDNQDVVRAALMKALPTARKKLLHSYAEDKDMFDTKGGQILGNGYYVNEKDKT